MDPWHYLLTGSLLKEGKEQCYLSASTLGCIPAQLPCEAREPQLPTPRSFRLGRSALQGGYLEVPHPHVPRSLQQELLREDAAATDLAGLVGGNRLAACATATGALLCYPAGLNAEALALTPIQLHRDADEEGIAEAERPALQVGPSTITPIATSAILQLAVATPREDGSLLAAHRPLLAARSAYMLSVLALEQGEQADEGHEGRGWSVGAGRSWSVRSPLADACWSPFGWAQGAALTRDLCLWGFSAEGKPQGRTMERLWSGSGYLSDLAQGPHSSVGSAGHRHSGASSGGACCQWGHHPRTVVLSTGRQLLSVDVRAHGGGGSEIRLWTCAQGEGLLSLSSPAQIQGVAGQEPYLAALTTRRLLLFDLRRPHLPAGAWDLPPPIHFQPSGPGIAQQPKRGEGVLEAAAAAAEEHMQCAQHALQLLRLPPNWLAAAPVPGVAGVAQRPQQHQRQRQQQQQQLGHLESAASPDTGPGFRLMADQQAEHRGQGAVNSDSQRPHVGCILHTDLTAGAATAYCFHTGLGYRFKSTAPRQGSRVGRLALEPLKPLPGAADGQASELSPAQQSQDWEGFALTQASQAPAAWDRFEEEGGNEGAPPLLKALEWVPAFMGGRVCEEPAQRVADPLQHRPRMAAALEEARQHAVQRAQLAALAAQQHAQQHAQQQAGGRGAVPAGRARAAAEAAAAAGAAAAGATTATATTAGAAGAAVSGKGQGQGQGPMLATAGSLGGGAPELHGAAAVWAPTSADDEALVLFRLTAAGDIVMTQVSPDPCATSRSTAPLPPNSPGMAPPTAAHPGPQPAPAVAGPSVADPMGGFEAPLLWPSSVTLPGELLTGAAAAEVKLQGPPQRKFQQAWLRQGKNLVRLDLHTQLMGLRLEEMRSCAAAAGLPASSADVPLPQQQHAAQQQQQAQCSGGSEQGAALRSMLQQQVGALAAPATLWELHASRAGGSGEAEDAEQARQPKRRRGAAWRGAQHAQHGMVPLLPKRAFSVKEAAAAVASGRFADSVVPFRQLAESLGLLGGAAPAPSATPGTAGREPEGHGIQQPAQRAAAAGTAGKAAATTQQQQGQQGQQQERHQGHASTGPRLFPPPAWLQAALSLPEAGGPGPGAADAGQSTAAAQQGSGSKGGQAVQWQAAVHLPAINASASSDPEAPEISGDQITSGLHPLKGDPRLSRALGYGVVLVDPQKHAVLPGSSSAGSSTQVEGDSSMVEMLRRLQEQWQEDWRRLEEDRAGRE